MIPIVDDPQQETEISILRKKHREIYGGGGLLAQSEYDRLSLGRLIRETEMLHLYENTLFLDGKVRKPHVRKHDSPSRKIQQGILCTPSNLYTLCVRARCTLLACSLTVLRLVKS